MTSNISTTVTPSTHLIHGTERENSGAGNLAAIGSGYLNRSLKDLSVRSGETGPILWPRFKSTADEFKEYFPNIPKVPGNPFAIPEKFYAVAVAFDKTDSSKIPYKIKRIQKQNTSIIRRKTYGSKNFLVTFDDGTQIKITRPPDQKNGKEKMKDIIENFSRLPKSLRESVDNIFVVSVNDFQRITGYSVAAGVLGFASWPNSPGGEGSIIIPETFADEGLEGILIHESSHLFPYKKFGLSKTNPNPPEFNEYKQAIQSDKIYPSKYGRDSGPEEDFCEAATLYLALIGTDKFDAYAKAMPARFAYFDKYLGFTSNVEHDPSPPPTLKQQPQPSSIADEFKEYFSNIPKIPGKPFAIPEKWPTVAQFFDKTDSPKIPYKIKRIQQKNTTEIPGGTFKSKNYFLNP